MDFSDPNSVISDEDLARILDRSDEGGPLPFLVPQDLTPVLPSLLLLTLSSSPLLCVCVCGSIPDSDRGQGLLSC